MSPGRRGLPPANPRERLLVERQDFGIVVREEKTGEIDPFDTDSADVAAMREMRRCIDQGAGRSATEIGPCDWLRADKPTAKERERVEIELTLIPVGARKPALAIHAAIGDDGGAKNRLIVEQFQDVHPPTLRRIQKQE